MNRDWNEAQIAALIDGSLDDPAETARLRTIIETDPEARAVAERIERVNRLIHQAYPLPEEEGTPDAIQAAIYGDAPSHAADTGNGEDDRVVRMPRRRYTGPTTLATAAGLVATLGTLLYLTGSPNPERPDVADLAPRDGALHRALETLPSGRATETGIQPTLTFHDGSGRVCREYERPGESQTLVLGIACRTPDDRWRLEGRIALQSSGDGSGGAYAPAAGENIETLDPVLDRLEAGPPLPPDREASLLRSGWSDTR